MICPKAEGKLDRAWDLWLEKGDRDACNDLIEAYIPLVDFHVQRVLGGLPRNVDAGDLKSHGLAGLYDALRKFDKNRDLKFDTYASFRIKGAILDGLRQEDRLPRSVRDKAKKIESIQETLEQELGRVPAAAEVAGAAGMTEAEVVRTMNESFVSHLLSIDEQSGEHGAKDTFVQSMSDRSMLTPEQHAVRESDYEELAACMKELTENEQLVLSLFYFEELTLTEIGQILSLSTSRISQIHSKALYKLEHSLRKSS
ncbi:FliA/WhiG family RNA polymerase sigma factor [Alteribacter natronophilus]|uniref:FliA/WhiG family RNA polymerase sigma factor n=1 Tax=Alteribacter natronophilus TaxID=2583810 RepID=UPI00110DCCC9|nr:FliA/WhiG family RNA polymerase sigma factor [Alteribacter natronophilus]TMW73232.1 FliA/WhiG family RNA polymerase sigma factor [Alteribacter natronophilus]